MQKKCGFAVFVSVWLVTMLCFTQVLHAKTDCLNWSETICSELGGIHLSCRYRGAAVVAEALVADKGPLKRKGFRFEDGAYLLTVTRLEKGRYVIGVKSMADSSRYQERVLTLSSDAEDMLSDNRPRGPGDLYYWNAAIEYDLNKQLGLIPTGEIPAKLIKTLPLYVTGPDKLAQLGMENLQIGDGIELVYQGYSRWHLTDSLTGSGVELKYLSKRWRKLGDLGRDESQESPVIASSDLLFDNSDFEKGTLVNWVKSGDAFDVQPTIGDNVLARRRGASNHKGRYWIGTYEAYSGKTGEKTGAVQGDKPTGILTSAAFKIRYDRIAFLLGGGRNDAQEYVALVISNKEVLKATGKNTEEMREIVWDVSDYKGKSAKIRIVDNSSKGFGHINVDDFRYSAGSGMTVSEISGPSSPTAPGNVEQPAGPSQPTQTDKTTGSDQVYDGWFPFPEHGWTTTTPRERSISGSLLEVKKTYVRQSDHAVLDITVNVKKGRSASHTSTQDGSEDLLPYLIGTLLDEIIDDSEKGSEGVITEKVNQQGIAGALKVEKSRTTLQYEHQDFIFTVRMNRRDRDATLAYGHKLDLMSAKNTFVVK